MTRLRVWPARCARCWKHEFSRMNIAIFAETGGGALGGGHTFFWDILDGLRTMQESGHRFFVLSETEAPGGLPPHIQWVRVAFPRRAGLPERAIRFAKRLMGRTGRKPGDVAGQRTGVLEDVFKQHRIDLVWEVAPRAMCDLLLEVPTVPFFATVWDLEHRCQPSFPEVSEPREWRAREHYYANVLPRAAGILTGTQIGRGLIQKFYNVASEKIHVMPLPTPRFALEAPPDSPEVLQKFGLPKDFLFYPAQFWAHKNHACLLRALARLKAERDFRPALALTGSDKGHLGHVRQLVDSLGLGDQIFQLGFVTREELVALYRRARALVFPTFFGPDNLPPLEAFALGCPVVASRVSGAEEQLGEAALLFDPQDDADLANTVWRLWNSEELRTQLIARGYVRGLRHTARTYVQTAIELLTALLSS